MTCLAAPLAGEACAGWCLAGCCAALGAVVVNLDFSSWCRRRALRRRRAISDGMRAQCRAAGERGVPVRRRCGVCSRARQLGRLGSAGGGGTRTLSSFLASTATARTIAAIANASASFWNLPARQRQARTRGAWGTQQATQVTERRRADASTDAQLPTARSTPPRAGARRLGSPAPTACPHAPSAPAAPPHRLAFNRRSGGVYYK